MATVFLSPVCNEEQFDNDNGTPLAGGKIYTYVGPGTTTPLVTYSDQAGTAPNTNPVIANSSGRFPSIYLLEGQAYSLVVTDSTDVVIKSYLGVNGVNDYSLPGFGSVTSVNINGNTTGLVFSNGPITSSGTIDVSGVLSVANGGTGSNNLATAAYVAASGVTPMTGNLNLNTNRITNMADPTSPQDAATKQYVDNTTPAGAVMIFATATVPTGWLECDGSVLSTTTYANLFASIGYTYGGSGGTFAIPDLRGYFVRGWDDSGLGRDPGRVFGSTQADSFASHNHYLKVAYRNNSSSGGVPGWPPQVGNGEYIGDDTTSIKPSGGSETRPKNVAMKYCIKY